MVVANAVDLDTMVNPKTGEITEVKGTPVVEKKHELPKTSSESNTATAVGLGVVGLGAAMTLRRRKQHR